MALQNKYLNGWLVLLGSITIALLYFYPIVLHPNAYLMSASGDGIKNYFTFIDYIHHNKSWFNFEGFNYPYGESIFYTDCHPFLAIPLKFIGGIFPALNAYTIGILNLILLSTFVLTPLFLYRLFVHYKSPKLIAVVAPITIAMLAPQILRLTGHFALSYSFIIPITLLRFLKTENKQLLFTALLSFIWFGIHAYLGMIVVSFLLTARTIEHFLIKRSFFRTLSTLLLESILPLVLFRLLVLYTDTHIGRTDNPFGFFHYYANINSVFLPIMPPLKPIFQLVYPYLNGPWEGWAYIGLFSVMMWLIWGFGFIKALVLKKEFTPIPKTLSIMAISSWVLLLFSFTFPFNLGLSALVDHFSALKQFRSIGRFAWPFFFVSSLFAFVYLQKITTKASKLYYALAIIGILGFGYEGQEYYKRIATKITSQPNLFDKTCFEKHYNVSVDALGDVYSNCPSILPIPSFLIGNETFGIEGTDNAFLGAQLFSYHLNKPLKSAYLTRTSIYETKNQILSLIGQGPLPKEMVSPIPNDSTLVLNLHPRSLRPFEASIWKNCNNKTLYNNLSLGSLKIKDIPLLLEIDSTHEQAFLQYSTDTIKAGNTKTLYHSDKADTLTGRYHAILWVYNCNNKGGQDQTRCSLVLEELSANKTQWTNTSSPSKSVYIYKHCWSQITLDLAPKTESNEIKVLLSTEDIKNLNFYIKNFRIAPKEVF